MKWFFPTMAVVVSLLVAPVAGQVALQTTFAGGGQFDGDMFRLTATTDVTILDFQLAYAPGTWNVEIYSLPVNTPIGGNVNQATNWTLDYTAQVTSAGTSLSSVGPLDIRIASGDSQIFYITCTNGPGMIHSAVQNPGGIYNASGQLEIWSGFALDYPFAPPVPPFGLPGSYGGWIWNGAIVYGTGFGLSYETNSPEAHLSMNGRTSSELMPVQGVCQVGELCSISLSSTLPSLLPFEYYISVGAVSRPAGRTAGGQAVPNVDLTVTVPLFGNGYVVPLNSAQTWYFFNSVPLVAASQFVIIDPGHVDGVSISAPLDFFVTDTDHVLGDDDSKVISFATPLKFYGTAYTTLFLNSNGNITFNAADTSFSPTATAFLSAEPRISLMWTDLDPSAAGTVRSLFVAPQISALDFGQVPGLAGPDDLTLIIDEPRGLMKFVFGATSSTEGLVGLSPGGGLSTAVSLDLNAGEFPVTPGEAVFELFTPGNPFDLAYDEIVFLLDAAGYPLEIR